MHSLTNSTQKSSSSGSNQNPLLLYKIRDFAMQKSNYEKRESQNWSY